MRNFPCVDTLSERHKGRHWRPPIPMKPGLRIQGFIRSKRPTFLVLLLAQRPSGSLYHRSRPLPAGPGSKLSGRIRGSDVYMRCPFFVQNQTNSAGFWCWPFSFANHPRTPLGLCFPNRTPSSCDPCLSIHSMSPVPRGPTLRSMLLFAHPYPRSVSFPLDD